MCIREIIQAVTAIISDIIILRVNIIHWSYHFCFILCQSQKVKIAVLFSPPPEGDHRVQNVSTSYKSSGNQAGCRPLILGISPVSILPGGTRRGTGVSGPPVSQFCYSGQMEVEHTEECSLVDHSASPGRMGKVKPQDAAASWSMQSWWFLNSPVAGHGRGFNVCLHL